MRTVTLILILTHIANAQTPAPRPSPPADPATDSGMDKTPPRDKGKTGKGKRPPGEGKPVA